ncbi:Fic family protein [Agilicoccus flavus]|uniref:Fic family protein n=1 Tax=Agilicoccus flavus TaxID=2775968 RepID=UPI001CF64FEF|nr:Fic family protein [Agilicoccus flavus]
MSQRGSEFVAAARVVAGWPEVAAAADAAREAATSLRWHEGLRRRTPEAAAESRVRGAHASAELDGARSDVAIVRDLVIGAAAWPDPLTGVLPTLRGAVRATLEADRLTSDVSRAPLRALARLHLAAGADLAAPDSLGRPRGPGQGCAEFVDLGPAPDGGPALSARLDGVLALLRADDVPALVAAALVHAELAHARPFTAGNGLVARAVERAVLVGRGLDVTAVAVPEAGHRRAGATAYLGALSAYGSGGRPGVALWVRHVGQAVVDGCDEGTRVADAVRAGRLG